MSVRTLGAAVLGGVRLATLHPAGWLDEHSTGAVATADTLLAGTRPMVQHLVLIADLTRGRAVSLYGS